MYGNPDKEKAAAQTFLNFRQKRFVVSYAAQFKQLAAKIKWANNNIFINIFYKKLKDTVKDKIIKVDKYIRFDDFVNKVIKIDNR